MKIMQNSDVPIYRQIASQFKDDIMNGRIGEGEYLPSIRGLAKDLKISVITTMKAYELLTQEGMIAAGQGLHREPAGPRDGKGAAAPPSGTAPAKCNGGRKTRRGIPRRAGGNAESTIRYRLRRVAICLYIHKKGRK